MARRSIFPVRRSHYRAGRLWCAPRCSDRPRDARQGVPGVVRAVTLLGAALRVDVELAGGARVLADIAHGGAALDFRRDDAVSVSFDSARVVFIPD